MRHVFKFVFLPFNYSTQKLSPRSLSFEDVKKSPASTPIPSFDHTLISKLIAEQLKPILSQLNKGKRKAESSDDSSSSSASSEHSSKKRKNKKKKKRSKKEVTSVTSSSASSSGQEEEEHVKPQKQKKKPLKKSEVVTSVTASPSSSGQEEEQDVKPKKQKKKPLKKSEVVTQKHKVHKPTRRTSGTTTTKKKETKKEIETSLSPSSTPPTSGSDEDNMRNVSSQATNISGESSDRESRNAFPSSAQQPNVVKKFCIACGCSHYGNEVKCDTCVLEVKPPKKAPKKSPTTCPKCGGAKDKRWATCVACISRSAIDKTHEKIKSNTTCPLCRGQKVPYLTYCESCIYQRCSACSVVLPETTAPKTKPSMCNICQIENKHQSTMVRKSLHSDEEEVSELEVADEESPKSTSTRTKYNRGKPKAATQAKKVEPPVKPPAKKPVSKTTSKGKKPPPLRDLLAGNKKNSAKKTGKKAQTTKQESEEAEPHAVESVQKDPPKKTRSAIVKELPEELLEVLPPEMHSKPYQNVQVPKTDWNLHFAKKLVCYTSQRYLTRVRYIFLG